MLSIGLRDTSFEPCLRHLFDGDHSLDSKTGLDNQGICRDKLCQLHQNGTPVRLVVDRKTDMKQFIVWIISDFNA